MLPLRLELRNFLAYRLPEPISFEGLEIACLSGPNGAGKSSLLDAITWALWGRSRVPGNRSDDELIHLGQTEMRVALEFRQEQAKYRVERTYTKRGARSQALLTFSMWNEEQRRYQLQSGQQTIRETQAQIVGVLKLDYDTFIHSAFLQQGKADSFTVKTPAERKKILAEILGLARWQDYEERAKQKLQKIDTDLNLIEAIIAEKAQEEAKEPGLRHELEIAEQQAERASADLQIAEEHLAEVANAPVLQKEKALQFEATQRRIKAAKEQLAVIDAEAVKQQKRLEKSRQIIADREAIDAGYELLEQARQIDYELGDKFKDLSNLEKQLAELNRQLDADRADLETQVGVHQDRIRQAERDIATGEALAAELAEIEVALNKLDIRKAERDAIRAEQSILEQANAELKANNKTLHAEMNTIKQRLTILDSAEGADCPVCGQPLDQAHRAELHDSYQADGTARGDTYRGNNARLKEIDETLTVYATTLRQIENDLRNYDVLKKQQGALLERVNQAQAAAERVGLEQAALEAVQRQIQDQQFSLPLRAEIANLSSEIDSLGYDGVAHSEAREALTTLRAFEVQKRELETALTSVTDVEANLQAIQERRERSLQALSDEQAAEAALQTELSQLAGRVLEEKQRRTEVNRLRAILRGAEETLITVKQQLKAVDDARIYKNEKQQHRDFLCEEQSIYQQLREAFGKNGIPAMMIEDAIPELEEVANKLLSRMTDGRMNVRFDTQREKKTGGTIETLDIMISDELGTRSYDMFSGGEGFRVNFALRIALSQFLARRAGARLQTLVIDEGFGSQDAIGRERLVEAINVIHADFDLILIVTHFEDMLEVFPAMIEVRKTPSGSVVTIH